MSTGPVGRPGCEILREMQALRSATNLHVFPGQRSQRALGHGPGNGDCGGPELTETPHGFRSAFRDWAGEETDYPREIAEAALAHQSGDAVERAYRRGDALEKRRFDDEGLGKALPASDETVFAVKEWQRGILRPSANARTNSQFALLTASFVLEGSPGVRLRLFRTEAGGRHGPHGTQRRKLDTRSARAKLAPRREPVLDRRLGRLCRGLCKGRTNSRLPWRSKIRPLATCSLNVEGPRSGPFFVRRRS